MKKMGRYMTIIENFKVQIAGVNIKYIQTFRYFVLKIEQGKLQNSTMRFVGSMRPFSQYKTNKNCKQFTEIKNMIYERQKSKATWNGVIAKLSKKQRKTKTEA